MSCENFKKELDMLNPLHTIKVKLVVNAKKGIFNSDSDKENHEPIVDTNKFTIEDVPSYHSFCNCKITYNKNDKGGE
jgi:hypothetical protein